MTYQETLDYLFQQLPMYQRIGQAAYKTDLNNTLELCKALGNPERKFRSVHIAGTNGKGSTSHFLASILQEAGYKVGLYTSPHLLDFRERIRINGKPISEQAVLDFVVQFKAQFEAIGLSFFEWTVGLAFHHFEQEKVDIAVLETGMGGRLDSTNVVTPLLSLITNIGLDHTQFLGDTLPVIAGEKAGIIKAGVPVIIGERQAEVESVFQEVAQAQHAPLHFADELLPLPQQKLGLLGAHQRLNARLASAAAHKLIDQGFSIAPTAIQNGLERVVANTGIRGRWEKLGEQPLTICDTGHNKAGITALLEQVHQTPHKKLHWVFGMVNDKSPEDILHLLTKTATYYFCQAKIPRALPLEKLLAAASEASLSGDGYADVKAAWSAAKADAAPEDLILIGGSTFVVADVLE